MDKNARIMLIPCLDFPSSAVVLHVPVDFISNIADREISLHAAVPNGIRKRGHIP